MAAAAGQAAAVEVVAAVAAVAAYLLRHVAEERGDPHGAIAAERAGSRTRGRYMAIARGGVHRRGISLGDRPLAPLLPVRLGITKALRAWSPAPFH